MDCILCLIFIVTCGTAGVCLLCGAIVRFHTLNEIEPPSPVRGVMLVQGELAINISSNTIDVVPYRNNTIQNPIEIDGTYIRVAEIQVGEIEIHPAAYAVMV